MEHCYHIDFETYSPEDLKNYGAFKYGEHPDTEILVAAISKDGCDPLVWSVMDPDPDALLMLQEAVESGRPIFAHNAQFEFAVAKYCWGKTFGFAPPALEQWRCTASLCRLAAIPDSLEKAAQFLGLNHQKDKEGRRLIQLFSVPQKPKEADPRTRIHWHEAPEDFKKFCEYCAQDVRVEELIHRKLQLLDNESPGHKGFHADLRMNDRGIPVNTRALSNANLLIAEYSDRLVPAFQEATSVPGGSVTLPVTTQRKAPKVVPLDDGFLPSQREMMMEFLKDRGYDADNLQEPTVAHWLENLGMLLTEEAYKALEIYSPIQSASIKKIPAMLDMSCRDGYVRGGLHVYGAIRTHRWAGRGIQPQNFARPTVGFTDLAYDMVNNGCSIADIEDNIGPLYAVLTSCVRHFIQPHNGNVLQADYSAIEARVAPWLCNAETTLEMFRRGDPVYEQMAVRIFNVALNEVAGEQRFVGKQAVLGCTYQMGPPKFRATCEKYGYTPSDEMVEAYKPRHKEFVNKMINRTKWKLEKQYERKGKDVPSSALTKEALQNRCMRENKWPTLHPSSLEEWREFTYDELAYRAVHTWREANSKIVETWRDLDRTAKQAINSPKTRLKCGRMELQYLPEEYLGFPGLFIKLPSGHYLSYPRAEVVPNSDMGGTHIRFWGVLPNSNGVWGWCHTYGGKLLENCTQAVAGDVMREGMYQAEAAGYNPFMLVHDEILCEQQPGQTHERLCELLCTMPTWAEGLPLAAEGGTIPYYKK